MSQTYPIPPQLVAMLVQAIIFYLDSYSYCPTGHPVAIVYSKQTISYIFTRVTLKSANVSYHLLTYVPVTASCPSHGASQVAQW